MAPRTPRKIRRENALQEGHDAKRRQVPDHQSDAVLRRCPKHPGTLEHREE